MRKFESKWDKTLSGFLVLAILVSLGALSYSIASPFKEPLTEFYLLDLRGKAADYPSLLSVEEEGKVVVGITNREHKTTSYQLGMKIEGVISNKVEQVTLKHKEKWKEVVSFALEKAGNKQKVEFLLYRQGQSEVYRSLYLWVDVQ